MQSLIVSATHSKSSRHIKHHYHDSHQILLVTSGTARADIDGKKYQLQKGSIVFISRYERHSVYDKSDDFCRYSLEILADTTLLYYHMQNLYSVLINRPDGFVHTITVDGILDELLCIFEKIVIEQSTKKCLFENQINLSLTEIMILLYRNYPQIFIDEAYESVKIVLEIQKRFESEPKIQYTLVSLSNDYHLSKYYLSHIFKKITGCSVMRYLQSCRIAAAKKLLAETELNIGEIIDRCGFSDFSNFSRTFKSLNGISPSEFRNKYK